MAASFLPLSSTPLLLLICMLGSITTWSSAADDVPAVDCPPHILRVSSQPAASKLKRNSTLRVLVPWKVGFAQFVNFSSHSCQLGGFSVEVFRCALNSSMEQGFPVPPYHFVVFGDGDKSPEYDSLIDMLVQEEVDMVVADLTITKKRMEEVAFTVPYLASSLAVLTTFSYGSSGAFWDFLQPFSRNLWIALLSCFVATGIVLCFLENQNPEFAKKREAGEHEAAIGSHGTSAQRTTAPDSMPANNSPASSPPLSTPTHLQSSYTAPADHGTSPIASPVQDTSYSRDNEDTSSLQRPGPPIYDQASLRRRAMNAYWFTSLCVFQSQQESVRTHLGRIITITWLFMMLIFNSSYTASLSSRLSAQKVYPNVQGLGDLREDVKIPVGYQVGSFVPSFLKEVLNKDQLKNFTSVVDFTRALKKGKLDPNGVGAIVDELPYIQLVLQSECSSFTVVEANNDHLPAYGGFGFAFRKGDPLLDEMSKRILEMAEDGTLQKLQSVWKIGDDKGRKCDSDEGRSHLRLRSFRGLFSIVVSVYFICVIWRCSSRVIKSREGSCNLNQAFPCARPHGSTIRRAVQELSLSRNSNRVMDESSIVS